tara:strand:- start:164 stop:583 length:420 start_codon:yes stop_codon:yes gene_type:complete
LTDDGLHDDTILNWPKVVAPPRAEHDWVPYEPHTTSMADQWTGLYHTTGPALAPKAAKEPEADDAEGSDDDEEEKPATKGAKARAATIAANPDLQPEVPTGPLVEGAGAKGGNSAAKTEGTPKPDVVAKGVDAARAATK